METREQPCEKAYEEKIYFRLMICIIHIQDVGYDPTIYNTEYKNTPTIHL